MSRLMARSVRKLILSALKIKNFHSSVVPQRGMEVLSAQKIVPILVSGRERFGFVAIEKGHPYP
ncbi:hypothetical protein [Paenibacillus sp. Soil787]|uniref:hypothetical protein n=1 Tax=Paenibacillus sp. Soil787 TaxID=1736411 RepID=UPI0012E3F352|nr:hypothetical protein [Paenibacillus sp. Soil787]